MTPDRDDLPTVAIVISFLSLLGFLAYLAWTRSQRNSKTTTTAEYDASGRPTKVEEKVVFS